MFASRDASRRALLITRLSRSLTSRARISSRVVLQTRVGYNTRSNSTVSSTPSLPTPASGNATTNAEESLVDKLHSTGSGVAETQEIPPPPSPSPPPSETDVSSVVELDPSVSAEKSSTVASSVLLTIMENHEEELQTTITVNSSSVSDSNAATSEDAGSLPTSTAPNVSPPPPAIATKSTTASDNSSSILNPETLLEGPHSSVWPYPRDATEASVTIPSASPDPSNSAVEGYDSSLIFTKKAIKSIKRSLRRLEAKREAHEASIAAAAAATAPSSSPSEAAQDIQPSSVKAVKVHPTTNEKLAKSEEKSDDAVVVDAVENTVVMSKKAMKKALKRERDMAVKGKIPEPPPPQEQEEQGLEQSLSVEKAEIVTDSWGPDRLAPPTQADTTRSPPPHLEVQDSHGDNFREQAPPMISDHTNDYRKRVSQLPYTRRVEGIFEPLREGVAPKDLAPPSGQRPIAKLAHGLDRVLFNPGVHWLQDPRSRVYNFSTWLEHVPKVWDFAFERVPGFIKSSRDDDLWKLTKSENAKFSGSTSSLTGMLGQIYFLLSNDRRVNLSSLSSAFRSETNKFTAGQRLPVSVILKYREGVYSTDSDPLDPGASEMNILTWMGTMLEKFLTMPEEEFTALLRSSPPVEIPNDDLREAYRYAKYGKLVMRSQLDCRDSRLPGTGVFDIKTRATMPIRLDTLNLQENSGYLIRTLRGRFESFESEYYDLIRSAFLKYSFQARIGNMDGVFVTYHNTARIFGFQYITLEEMDEALYRNPAAGKYVFDMCLRLLEAIMEEVTSCFPEQSVACVWNMDDSSNVLNIWVQPAEWDTEKGEKPIVQLDVTVTNYLGDQFSMPYYVADWLGERPWTVQWSIGRSKISASEARKNRRFVTEMQNHYYVVPTGMNIRQMEKHWESLDYSQLNPSKPKNTKRPAFDARRARFATGLVANLRRLSRVGRKDTERLAKLEAGKRKIVWGAPEVVEDETEEPGNEEREAVVVNDPEVAQDTKAALPTSDSKVVSDRDVEASEEPGNDTERDSPNGSPNIALDSDIRPTGQSSRPGVRIHHHHNTIYSAGRSNSVSVPSIPWNKNRTIVKPRRISKSSLTSRLLALDTREASALPASDVPSTKTPVNGSSTSKDSSSATGPQPTYSNLSQEAPRLESFRVLEAYEALKTRLFGRN